MSSEDRIFLHASMEDAEDTLEENHEQEPVHHRVFTLGERLSQEARRIALRHLPHFTWLHPFELLMEHISSLPIPEQARFQRRQVERPMLPIHPTSAQWTFVGRDHRSESGAHFQQPLMQSLREPVREYTESTQLLTEDMHQETRYTQEELPVSSSHTSWQSPSTDQAGTFTRPEMNRERAIPRRPLSPQQHRAGTVSMQPSSTDQAGTFTRPETNRERAVPGRPLTPQQQQRLQQIVGPGVEHMRVHDDQAADEIARQHKAEAVTIGQHVFFRQDHLQPENDEGFALLTHEAAHVIQAMRPGAAWLRATRMGIQEAEQEARKLERVAFDNKRGGDSLAHRQHGGRAPQSTRYGYTPMFSEQRPKGSTEHYSALSKRQRTEPGRQMASPGGQLAAASANAPSTILRPMAAATDRSRDNDVTQVPIMPDLEEMKRQLQRDLLRQIRTDMERGG